MMNGAEAVGERLVSLYEALYACAVRQKEAVLRGDMGAFEEECAERERIQRDIDSLMSEIVDERPGGSLHAVDAGAACVRMALSLARRTMEVDDETRKHVEAATAELRKAFAQIATERRGIAAYGDATGFVQRDTRFLDRLK